LTLLERRMDAGTFERKEAPFAALLKQAVFDSASSAA
jgi:hypothetical protein